MNYVATCNSPALALGLSIVKKILSVIQIAGPIVCIISLFVSFTLIIINPEDKKEPAKIKNKLFALVLLFLVPSIVNLSMGLVDNRSSFSSCWNQISDVRFNSGENYVSHGRTPSNPIYNQTELEYGDPNLSDKNKNKNNNSNFSASKIVFIGDSRTVQMYAYLSNDWSKPEFSSGGVHTVDDSLFVAQGSMGLNWMKNTGIPAAKQYFGNGTAIVINMGVNDLNNIDSYISYINSNISDWTKNGAKVYYATVNPCNKSYSSLNTKINTFNTRLKNDLSNDVKIIDTNSYLVSNGFSTTDGLHYSKETSDAIYNYIKNNL